MHEVEMEEPRLPRLLEPRKFRVETLWRRADYGHSGISRSTLLGLLVYEAWQVRRFFISFLLISMVFLDRAHYSSPT